MGLLTTEVQSDDKNIKETVENHVAKLKNDLCELEGSVTAHSSAIPALRHEVKGALTQVTELTAKASSGQSSGVSLDLSLATLDKLF